MAGNIPNQPYRGDVLNSDVQDTTPEFEVLRLIAKFGEHYIHVDLRAIPRRNILEV